MWRIEKTTKFKSLNPDQKISFRKLYGHMSQFEFNITMAALETIAIAYGFYSKPRTIQIVG